MKTKAEPNELKTPIKLGDDALGNVVGGARDEEIDPESGSNVKMCEISMCPYTNRQDCPMYHVLPQFCVR